jgi:DNA polymerase elongation subunit (family B)
MNHTIHIFDAIARDQKIVNATKDTIEVQYLSEDSDDSGFKKKRPEDKSNREMVIHLFGTKPSGESVRIEVNGFRPFFYIELPANLCKTPSEESYTKIKLQESICRSLKSNSKAVGFELIRKQKLLGYTGGKLYSFLKIHVPSLGMFYDLRKIFLDDTQKPKFRMGNSNPLEVYESNIDPMLRFFHIQNIQPCGWICVKGVELESSNSMIQLQADWQDIIPCESPPGVVTAPFKHAFWDIECYSHDTEFPMAQQGYRRVAKQLWYTATPPDIPNLLKLAFAGKGSIKIPPLKHKNLKPLENDISKKVESQEFKDKLKEIWEGRDSLLVKQKEERLSSLTSLLDRTFERSAPIAGDPVIQIGTVSVQGSVIEKHIFVLGGCSELPGIIIHKYTNEKDMLLAWFQWLLEENFDIFSGYNIFGFDERYVWDRLVELGVDQDERVQSLTRLFDQGGEMKLVEKFLSSSALGDNMLYMWNTPGRLRIDLYGHIKRKIQLTSYKLDSVCAAFLSGKLSGIQASSKGQWILKTKQKGDARIGRYVQILNDLGEDLSDKMEILEIVSEGFVVSSEENLAIISGEAAKWAVVKDDVSPQDLFRLHRGSDADRARIAAYCIQDCDLVYELYKKLEVFNEAMSMANVCSVPVSYIFTRGQGIKIESLIFKDCMDKNQLIVVQPSAAFGSTEKPGSTEIEEGYEGAIVLDPIPGFYADAPIGVCDFASLYPSTIISENISHDMLVWTKDYNLEGKLMAVKYGSVEAEALAPAGTRFTDIEFDILRPEPDDTHKHPKKVRMGTRICRYAQPEGNQKGSLPQIVGKLLAARKAKRKEIEKTDDPFKKALLDAEQNAYKITANSLYGQLGSRTFKIRLQDLAASVTAYARKQIMFSKAAIEQFYGPGADSRCSAEVVYGDTDSLFVNFNPRDEAGNRLTGREAIVKTIELTTEAGKFITGALRAPHDFEYDKVFSPFIIFSKKRYVGNKYEDSPDEFKETSMGIVLKRRDNAPLLKMIYSGALDRLLNHRDVKGAVDFVTQKVEELVDGKISLSQLTITKSLAAEYKSSPPAHKVLADRIAARDPGNAPSSGERVAFIYVQPPPGQVASKLQGDRVETPGWIQEKGLKPDAEYYIQHQLFNPLAQLFGILVEQMPGYIPVKWSDDPDKCIGERENLAGSILFKRALQKVNQNALTDFATKLGASVRKETVQKRKPALDPALAAVAPKKQSSMDAFLKDTALSTDERTARMMRSHKRGIKNKE